MTQCKCAADADMKLRIAGRSRRATDRCGEFPARLPRQHNLRRLERDHASLHRTRGARPAFESRRRNFQHATADVRARKAVFSSENFTPAGIRASGCRTARARSTICTNFRPRQLRGAHEQTTRARFVSRHGAVRSETGPEQLLLSRFVGIATELFAISATCSYAQWLLGQGKPADEILRRRLFLRSARMRIDHHFAGTARNVDKRGYDLVQDLLAESMTTASGHGVKVAGVHLNRLGN